MLQFPDAFYALYVHHHGGNIPAEGVEHFLRQERLDVAMPVNLKGTFSACLNMVKLKVQRTFEHHDGQTFFFVLLRNESQNQASLAFAKLSRSEGEEAT